MRLYRVRGWDSLFENAQSRKCTKLAWVLVPNKHDGKSFRRLMCMENGPSLYGAWVILLQVASKCPERGILADEDGPLTAEDLALKSGCPEGVFIEALEVLSSPQIRWLEAEEIDATGSELGAHSQTATSTVPLHSTESALNRTEREEQKGRESKNGAADAARDSAKSRQRKKKLRSVAIPNELDAPDVRQALEEFREHRRQIGKKLTPLAEQKLLTEWADKGVDRFVAAVNHSIANGWQGLFEPHNGNRSQGSAQPELMGSLNRFVEAGGDE